MTMPTSQCPWRMQVHHIHQETPDVWTLSLLCHDYYPYRAGQYALVSVRNSADTLRAYTISSTPGRIGSAVNITPATSEGHIICTLTAVPSRPSIL